MTVPVLYLCLFVIAFHVHFVFVYRKASVNNKPQCEPSLSPGGR